MKLKSYLNVVLAITGLVLCSSASANKVTTGRFVLDFDEVAWLNLPTQLANTAWFDEKNSKDKTGAQLRAVKNEGCFVSDAYIFNVFGESVDTPPTGLQERKPQISTFDYKGDPKTGKGVIGLAGVHLIGNAVVGQLSFGDYHLSYDATHVGNSANGSGWVLTNNVSFPAPAFDLTNVKTTIIDDTNFSLSGDVVLTEAIATMISSKVGTDVGNFTFTTEASAKQEMPRYVVKTKTLMIPVIKAAGKNYNVSLSLMNADVSEPSLEITCAKATTATADNAPEYNIKTGIVRLPKVEVVDTTGAIVEIPVQLKAVQGSAPLKFKLHKVGE